MSSWWHSTTAAAPPSPRRSSKPAFSHSFSFFFLWILFFWFYFVVSFFFLTFSCLSYYFFFLFSSLLFSFLPILPNLLHRSASLSAMGWVHGLGARADISDGYIGSISIYRGYTRRIKSDKIGSRRRKHTIALALAPSCIGLALLESAERKFIVLILIRIILITSLF